MQHIEETAQKVVGAIAMLPDSLSGLGPSPDHRDAGPVTCRG